MAIHSDSFFHYTNTIDIIEGILCQGFRISYCLEEVYSDSEDEDEKALAIPMVSFCDISLSNFDEVHYGNYCIGMSRAWGIKRQLEPVMYYPANKRCFSAKSVMRAMRSFLDDNNKKNVDDYSILSSAKPIRKISNPKNYNPDNYIEREWRKLYYPAGQYKWKTKQEYEENSKHTIDHYLKFTIDDIDAVIIAKEDMEEFVRFVMSSEFSKIGGVDKPISMNDKYKLLTKIIYRETLLKNI